VGRGFEKINLEKNMKKGFTLIELVMGIAIIGVIALIAVVFIWKVFVAKSVKDGVDVIKANVVYTTSLRCVDATGREQVSYTGLKNACRTGDNQIKITSSDGTVRTIPVSGCSISCAGNSPVDCGQVCQ
jgi:prepilin-type N-terminal cleavage/methylation domain-containing protein